MPGLHIDKFGDELFEHYGVPVINLVQLAGIKVANITDQERHYVDEEGSDYFFDTDANEGDIAPNDQVNNTGFWIKDETNSIIKVDSIASLKALKNPAIKKVVIVLGYYASGDGGGGSFYWDAASVEDDNGGTIIRATGIANGRWKRTNGDYLFLESFGAVSGQDSTQAIEKAIASNIPTLFGIGGSEFFTSKEINFPSGINLIGLGGNISFKRLDAGIIFKYTQQEKSSQIVSAYTSQNLTVPDASSFEIGDLIIVTSDVLWYYENRGTAPKGEITTVKGIQGNVIALKDPITDNYQGETLTVKNFSPTVFNLSNITLKGKKNIDGYVGGRFEYIVNSSFKNIQIFDCTTTGINIFGSDSVEFDSPRIFDCNKQGTGYGLWINANNSWVKNGYFNNCRGPVDFSSGGGLPPSRRGFVVNSIVEGGEQKSTDGMDLNGRGLGTHGGAEFITFSHNKISNVSNAIRVRGKDVHSIGNEFKNIQTFYYHISAGADFKAFGDKTVFDTKGTIKDFGALTLPVSVANFSGEYYINSSSTLINNQLFSTDYSVLFNDDLPAGDINGLVVTGNSFKIYNPTALYAAFLRAVGGRTANNSIVLRNDYSGDVAVEIFEITEGANSQFSKKYLLKDVEDTKTGRLNLVDELNANGAIYSIENSTIRINNPKGGVLKENGPNTGAIKIKLPNSDAQMMQFEVNIFDYASSDRCVKILLGGYSAGTWAGTWAKILAGSEDKDFTVRFGDDGDTKCVWIGEVNSAWGNINVSVNNYIGFFANVDNRWLNGWAISLELNFQNVDKVISNNLPYSDWNRTKNKPDFDKYDFWNLLTNGVQRKTIQSKNQVNFIEKYGIKISYSANGGVEIENTLGGTVDVAASRNLLPSDNGKTLLITGNDIVLTVVTGLGSDFACNFMLLDPDTGVCQIVAGAGFTLNAPLGYKLLVHYTANLVKKTGVEEGFLRGELTP